jgi:hypothetical protein
MVLFLIRFSSLSGRGFSVNHRKENDRIQWWQSMYVLFFRTTGVHEIINRPNNTVIRNRQPPNRSTVKFPWFIRHKVIRDNYRVLRGSHGPIVNIIIGLLVHGGSTRNRYSYLVLHLEYKYVPVVQLLFESNHQEELTCSVQAQSREGCWWTHIDNHLAIYYSMLNPFCSVCVNDLQIAVQCASSFIGVSLVVADLLSKKVRGNRPCMDRRFSSCWSTMRPCLVVKIEWHWVGPVRLSKQTLTWHDMTWHDEMVFLLLHVDYYCMSFYKYEYVLVLGQRSNQYI